MKRIVMLATFVLAIGISSAAMAQCNGGCVVPAPRPQQLACEGGNWPNNCRAVPEPADTGLPQGAKAAAARSPSRSAL